MGVKPMRSRRPKMSLRVLLACVTLCAVLAAVLRYIDTGFERQNAAIAALMGRQSCYVRVVPVLPSWLESVSGLKWRRVEALTLYHQMEASDIRHVRDLGSIESVFLSDQAA